MSLLLFGMASHFFFFFIYEMEQTLFVTMNLNEILICLPATCSQLSLLQFYFRFLVCVYYKM